MPDAASRQAWKCIGKGKASVFQHRRYERSLSAYVDNELSPSASGQLEAHLAPAERKELEEQRIGPAPFECRQQRRAAARFPRLVQRPLRIGDDLDESIFDVHGVEIHQANPVDAFNLIQLL